MVSMNTPHTHALLASSAQIRLLTDLIAKHDVPEGFLESLRTHYRSGTLTRSLVSSALTLINELPMKPAEDINVERAVVLRHGRTLLRVAPTNDGGYRTSVFKSLDGAPASFIDRHVPVGTLRNSRELTDSEMKSFVKATGLCGNCGFKTAGAGSKRHANCRTMGNTTEKEA